MTGSDRLLRFAVAVTGIALVLMLIALAWPTPATLGAFLGGGLPLGMLGMAAFVVRVLRDLRTRGAL